MGGSGGQWAVEKVDKNMHMGGIRDWSWVSYLRLAVAGWVSYLRRRWSRLVPPPWALQQNVLAVGWPLQQNVLVLGWALQQNVLACRRGTHSECRPAGLQADTHTHMAGLQARHSQRVPALLPLETRVGWRVALD